MDETLQKFKSSDGYWRQYRSLFVVGKTVNPDAKVIAFEPVERVFEKLEHNCRINNFDISCRKAAVSDFNGEVDLFDSDGDHEYTATLSESGIISDAAVNKVKVEAVSLSKFIELERLTYVDLMKIDVEKHEPEVLKGMGIYLQRFKPTIIIEILDQEIGVLVEEIVKEVGYLYFNINEKNGVRLVDTITKSDDFNFLLCIPDVAVKLNLIKK